MIKCEICGKEFKEITNTHLGQHEMSMKEYMSSFPNNKVRSEESNYNRGSGHRDIPLSEEEKEKLRKPKSEHMKDALKLAYKEGRKLPPNIDGSWNKGLTKENHPSIMSTSQKLMGHPGQKGDDNPSKRPEVRKKLSDKRIELLKDDEWTKFWIKSFHKSPNKPEQRLINIIEKYQLPYKFVGNGEFILGGKNPDFMNINGEKKLIEIYGTYWHRNENPEDRIDLFKEYGFETLIFWENELNDEQEIINKINKI